MTIPDSITPEPPAPASLLASSQLVEQAFTRASGAPLVKGNSVRLLKDGAANYPAWIAAIRSARKTVYFENYIIENDAVGREIAEALAERARAGVKVRLVRDWLGSLGGARRRFWRSLAAAGVDIRVFNIPRLASPLGWLSRDHRKTITVDGAIAFVSGLCVSQRWLGDPERGIPPWRDTGVEIRGPAVAFVERAFRDVWLTSGGQLAAEELSDPDQAPIAGDVPVRVIASTPSRAGLFRMDQLIATAARRTLWLTDALLRRFRPVRAGPVRGGRAVAPRRRRALGHRGGVVGFGARRQRSPAATSTQPSNSRPARGGRRSMRWRRWTDSDATAWWPWLCHFFTLLARASATRSNTLLARAVHPV